MKLKLEEILRTHTCPLQHPCLERISYRGITWHTDPQLEERGMYIGFTERTGGCSDEPFLSLNLATHVEDSLDHVVENRARLTHGVCAYAKLDSECTNHVWAVPKQIHGDTVLKLSYALAREAFDSCCLQMAAGCDALVLESPLYSLVRELQNSEPHSSVKPSPLLCFADCVPVIIVSPLGSVAVIHAGWRGVVNGIVLKALDMLCTSDRELAEKLCESLASVKLQATLPEIPSSYRAKLLEYLEVTTQQSFRAEYNCYIGPHIRDCCFEVDSNLMNTFVGKFGLSVSSSESHISLEKALALALTSAGMQQERIVSHSLCTCCNTKSFYSYRAESGTCGRHAAFACNLLEDHRDGC